MDIAQAPNARAVLTIGKVCLPLYNRLLAGTPLNLSLSFPTSPYNNKTQFITKPPSYLLDSCTFSPPPPHPSLADFVVYIQDMTFRDYAQGAFRMRGIGRGQTVQLYLIPEVEELMRRDLPVCAYACACVCIPWIYAYFHIYICKHVSMHISRY